MWQHQNSGAGGGAHVVLACWWGNGLPRLRCLAGVGARPAPLELRHCPDTYGWLQSRIFGNGRKSDRATPRGGRRPSGCKLLSGGSKGNLNYPLKKHGLSSCQQPRQDEPCERCSESLGLKGAQAEGQVRGEIPQLNWGSAPDTDFLEEGRGTWNYWWSGEMRRDQQERRWRKRRAGPFLTLRRESQGSERDQIPRQSWPQTMSTRLWTDVGAQPKQKCQVLRLGSMVARLKLKGIDGGSHKRWSMWLNSRLREEPYPGLDMCESARKQSAETLFGITGHKAHVGGDVSVE
eukprot:TRINITY_DN586_c0_g2_i2.p1 TRINITY_DN586_c0_g2~~TRINITY_DN586_c0_g2_i2.p1  ORF type:complete len:291 (-),score=-0.58 TRINITY_DN586_c0_g2_i2:258-1130(-)